MSAAVELTDVTRSFGPIAVLKGIDLSVPQGQVVAVYGRSGSGKTTLLNLIGGLDRPSGGRIKVAGQELAGLNTVQLDELRRRKIGFVFQSYGLLSHLTAWENVLFGLRLAGVPRQQWDEAARDSLEAVGLAGRVKYLPRSLSGGERQRVTIARALAVRPSLILADEPTGALDHQTGMQIIDLLVRFAAQTGATVWMVTHDIAIRERVDRAYRIIDGRLSPE
jgi:putative ABC transport system ATP-binding protein